MAKASNIPVSYRTRSSYPRPPTSQLDAILLSRVPPNLRASRSLRKKPVSFSQSNGIRGSDAETSRSEEITYQSVDVAIPLCHHPENYLGEAIGLRVSILASGDRKSVV